MAFGESNGWILLFSVAAELQQEDSKVTVAVVVNTVSDAVSRCCLLEVHLFPMIHMAVPRVPAGSGEDPRLRTCTGP